MRGGLYPLGCLVGDIQLDRKNVSSAVDVSLTKGGRSKRASGSLPGKSGLSNEGDGTGLRSCLDGRVADIDTLRGARLESEDTLALEWALVVVVSDALGGLSESPVPAAADKVETLSVTAQTIPRKTKGDRELGI